MVSEPDAVDLLGAARAAGLHYDTLRKHWRAWSDPTSAAYCGFPPPFRYPPPGRRGRLAWRASQIEAWKAARERAFGTNKHHPPGAPRVYDERRVRALTPQVLRQRAELSQLMEKRG